MSADKDDAELLRRPVKPPEFLQWYTDQTILELRVKLEGRVHQFREAVDGHWWYMHFKDRPEEWEQFTLHWLRSQVGRLVDDPEVGALLYGKLFVVTPEDAHDSRVCRRTHESDVTARPWPACLHGVVQTNDPGRDYDHFWSDGHPAGRCPCRCHKDPRVQEQVPHPGASALPLFDDRGMDL